MTPKAEIITMTKQGLANFILELKRTKLRHQMPYKTFVASRDGQDGLDADAYARHIDAAVTKWEQKQQQIVEDARKPKDSKPEGIMAGLNQAIRDGNADLLAATFNSVRFYLGKLNRNVNQSRVLAYWTDMQDGKWWFTPDPVVVTDDGSIINGQHRLLAVEGALGRDELTDENAPSFVVVWGVDKRAAILMDEARRTTSDRRDITIRFASAA